VYLIHIEWEILWFPCLHGDMCSIAIRWAHSKTPNLKSIFRCLRHFRNAKANKFLETHGYILGVPICSDIYRGVRRRFLDSLTSRDGQHCWNYLNQGESHFFGLVRICVHPQFKIHFRLVFLLLHLERKGGW